MLSIVPKLKFYLNWLQGIDFFATIFVFTWFALKFNAFCVRFSTAIFRDTVLYGVRILNGDFDTTNGFFDK